MAENRRRLRQATWLRGYFLIAAIVATALLGTAACGSIHEESSPSPSATSGGSRTPTATPLATPTNAEAALAGVTELIQRTNAARCPTPQPAVGNCDVLALDAANSGTDFDHGLGTFKVINPQEGDTTMVVGRTADGQWFQYLWGDSLRFLYNPIQLPSQVTICAFGEKAKVYSSSNPSSGEVGKLADGASANAEQFVLTQPGSIGNAGVRIQGYGWYRLAEPAGWVYSKYVAAGPGCSLHDQLERP